MYACIYVTSYTSRYTTSDFENKLSMFLLLKIAREELPMLFIILHLVTNKDVAIKYRIFLSGKSIVKSLLSALMVDCFGCTQMVLCACHGGGLAFTI